MAYTKIHAIKASVSAAVNYIINPNKTDEKLLVDSFGCAPETAVYDFRQTLSRGRSSDGNKAFHLIQSFLPGEVSYNEAHLIGIELADKLLEGKYSYVVSTHIDKNHVHNHIIFCATDNIEHKKYDDNKRSYYHIRELSDELCREHNLSIITPVKRGMKYNEWAEKNESISQKEQLKIDIDSCIDAAKDYDDFIRLIQEKGYEVKGHEFEEGCAKYIAFRPKNAAHFMRGSERTIGAGYTKEMIKNRILSKNHPKIPFPKKDPLIVKPKDITKPKRMDGLIDTCADKFKNSPGLKRWANVQNLKLIASTYARTGSIRELEENILSQKALVKSTRQDLISLEKELKPKAEILHYAQMYCDNLRFERAYKKSKDPDRYYREHAEQLNLFHAAEHALSSVYHVNPQTMDYDWMHQNYVQMEERRTQLSSSYHTSKTTLAEMEKRLENMRKFMGQTDGIHEETKDTEVNRRQEKDDKSDKSL